MTIIIDTGNVELLPKSLQSCPTLCDPIDGSPPGSPVPEIHQARTLEWVAIAFSEECWKEYPKNISNSCLISSEMYLISYIGSPIKYSPFLIEYIFFQLTFFRVIVSQDFCIVKIHLAAFLCLYLLFLSSILGPTILKSRKCSYLHCLVRKT